MEPGLGGRGEHRPRSKKKAAGPCLLASAGCSQGSAVSPIPITPYRWATGKNFLSCSPHCPNHAYKGAERSLVLALAFQK